MWLSESTLCHKQPYLPASSWARIVLLGLQNQAFESLEVQILSTSLIQPHCVCYNSMWVIKVYIIKWISPYPKQTGWCTFNEWLCNNSFSLLLCVRSPALQLELYLDRKIIFSQSFLCLHHYCALWVSVLGFVLGFLLVFVVWFFFF